MIHCEICKESMDVILWKHLLKHNLTLQQYKQQFPNSPVQSPEAIERKSRSAKKANASRKGIPRSKQVIDKIKETKSLNPKQAWNKGIPRTKEQNEHLSKVRKEKFAAGEITHWNLGKTTSEQTKEKISNTLLAQQRSYSEQSKEKRLLTVENKKLNGWVHPSTLRKGVLLNLTEESRQRMKEAAKQANKKRSDKKMERIDTFLKQHDIIIESISDNGYKFNLHCQKCGTSFIRTVSVLAPYRYDLYKGQYCPTCYPIYTGFYSAKYFEDNPHMKTVNGIFYVALISSSSEQFIKIGITTRDAHSRLTQESMYDFNVLLEFQMNLFDAFTIEQQLLFILRLQKYIPENDMGGKTECLCVESLQEVAYHIDNIIFSLNIPAKIVGVDA